MRRAVTIAILLLALGAAAALADYSEGGAFVMPQYGARGWAIGGAAVATVDDEGAISWNPAMLGRLSSDRAGASYINLVPGETARQSQIAYARVLRRGEPDASGHTAPRHVVGAMVSNLHLGIAGGESYDENTVRGAYAYSPDYFVTFAIAGDLFFSNSGVPGFSAVGTSVDFAGRLMLTERVTVGAVARDAFSRYSYDGGGDYQKERSYVLGASYTSPRGATIESDLVFAHNGIDRVAGGLETDYLLGYLSLRAGLAHVATGEGRDIPYFGFGVAAGGRLFIHYNANLDDEKALEDTHRFTLSVTL